MKFLPCLLILINLLLIPIPTLAETMTSPSYKIQFGNFNITSGKKSSSSYSLTDTVGQTAAGQFDSTGYTLYAGFQYIYTLYPFSFSISNLNLDFGTLTPNNPTTLTNTITVSAPGAGYSLLAIAAHPPTSTTSDTIPFTACDNSACTPTSASPWTLTTTYGFGFNVAGPAKSSDFVDTTYFRPFADKSQNQSPALIASFPSAVQNQTSTLTYKINISPTQPAGTYTTYLTFIATPKY